MTPAKWVTASHGLASAIPHPLQPTANEPAKAVSASLGPISAPTIIESPFNRFKAAAVRCLASRRTFGFDVRAQAIGMGMIRSVS